MSASHGWYLFRAGDWWVWLVVAAPAVILVIVFALGFGRLDLGGEQRRRVALVLLTSLVVSNLVGVSLVLGAVLGGHDGLTGGQLLMTAVVVLSVNVITFALVFWEVDCGGPIARAIAGNRANPDFWFPQDAIPAAVEDGWATRLTDYLYLSLTNSVAFSPTDTMPLSSRAKLFMGVESLIAAATVLIVAARAVNFVS
ncbi:MAG: hypothetical protein EXQ81_11100 [Thermoleophilia bacterium]|nr:hypothetical protein [Thermoleophilia bacterium]